MDSELLLDFVGYFPDVHIALRFLWKPFVDSCSEFVDHPTSIPRQSVCCLQQHAYCPGVEVGISMLTEAFTIVFLGGVTKQANYEKYQRREQLRTC